MKGATNITMPSSNCLAFQQIRSSMMYDGTLYGRSFTKGADPNEEHEEHEGKHEENTRESLKPTRFGHTYARSSKHKEIHDPNPTKDDT